MGDRTGIKEHIRDFDDFPKRGIVFRDVSPLLKDPAAMEEALEGLYSPFGSEGIDAVVGIEARGFVFGAAVASKHGLGFVMLRKRGKLPGRTESVSYTIEYGSDTLEIQSDALGRGERILIVDDLLATGGSASAAAQLVERLGGVVAGIAFVVELSGLGGRERLKNYRVESLIRY